MEPPFGRGGERIRDATDVGVATMPPLYNRHIIAAPPAKWPLGVEIAMGVTPVPIYVSRGHFALRYEVPKFLPRGGHLCMAMLTIAELATRS